MSQGRVRYHALAEQNWDPYTTSNDPEVQAFIRDNVHQVRSFTPFFDDKLAWMPPAYCYRDAYAVYVDPNQVPNGTAHPEMIARDVDGNPLYIPWGPPTGDQPYPQYAGDVSSPDFREFMVGFFRDSVTNQNRRYGGLWLDDVNLEPRIGDANGQPCMPVDRFTGKPMTPEAWALRFAEYLELVRNALPFTAAIVHNAIWTAPQVRAVNRQIAACDFYYLERGYSDGGLTGGTGQFSLDAFMKFIDRVHILGAPVILGEYSAANLDYGLAGYLLTNDGRDMIGFTELAPNEATWPAILSTDLGFAIGARQQIMPGIWARMFQRGAVYLNEPGSPTQTVFLPCVMIDSEGREVSEITLEAKQGAVLRILEQR